MPRTITRPIVGIDLGGTNMQIGVVSAENKILGRSKRKTKAADGKNAVIGRIVDGIEEACAAAKIPLRSIAGVGIGAPGAIEPHKGVVLQAPNLRWNNVPLAKILAKKTDRPVYLDNDVNVAVFGEHRLGAGQDVADMMGVWIGTGIGGGIILNNRLYHGHFFTAGEIGHTTLFPHMPPGSTSLEHNCSRTAIVDRIVHLIKSNTPSVVPQMADNDLTDIKARIVADAYARGDKLTRAVVDNAAQLLGIGIANVVSVMGFPRIVLGGGLTEAMGETLVALVRKSCRAVVYPDVCKRVEIVATKLEADAGLLGAALLAREKLATR